MKRKGNIYTQIIEKDNIKMAIQNASKGKKNRKSVKKIINNIDFCTEELQNMLKTKTYVPSPYFQMKILDGSRKKERIIFKPQFYPDQCIHWSLMQVIKDLIMRGMYEMSCASIPRQRNTLWSKLH